MYYEKKSTFKKLPLKLRKNGFNYTQILRIGDYCLYEQNCNSGIEHNEPGITPVIKYYEVFRVRIRPAETIKGKEYLAREVFPRNEDFGITAWSFCELGMAIVKLLQLKGHKS